MEKHDVMEALETALEPRHKREVAREGAALLARPEGSKAPGIQPQRPTRELFDLAWPIAAAMIGEVAMGLVDTKLVGGISASALGGVGIATTLMFLGYSIVFGTMRGVKVATSHAIGEGKRLDGFVFTRAGVLMSFASGSRSSSCAVM